jgi:hypothetical protein
MPSSISVSRRRQGLVELTVPRRAGSTGFRFSAAPNFDGLFTPFQVVPNYGLRSRSAPPADGVIGHQFREECRFVFAPSDYTVAVPAVRDDLPFYVRIEQMNPNGTFGLPEGMQIILPYNTVGNPAVVLHGTAVATGVTGALEINLPGVCEDFTIKNGSSGANLFVSFGNNAGTGPVGPEYLVTSGDDLNLNDAATSRLYVRGGTAASAEVYAICTRKTQPLNL